MKNPFIIIVALLTLTLSACTSSDIALPKTENKESVIYVSHLKENALTALDLSTGSQEKVSLPFRFSSIVEMEPGKFMASVKEEESLYEINTMENKVTEFMDIEEGVLELLYDQDNKLLYTVNGKSSKLQVIDLEKKEVVLEVNVGEYPSKMVKYGERLFVLAAGSGEVYILDTYKNDITNSFSVNARPEGLHFDGKYIWTGGHGETGEMNEKVFAYDPETGDEMLSKETGLMPIQISQITDTSSIYVLSHGDHSLTKLNRDTYEVEKKIHVGDNPSYMIADGSNLYVSSLDGDEVFVLEKDSLDVIEEYGVQGGPFLLFKGGDGE
ncbi:MULTISPECIES: YncE family protein [unclassified Sutcliffiella]|uniref:YncE family protein n=1 Tax=unclassified Sutcliffiella TaxID=2837532 RepID=UPI0030D0A757